MDLKQIYEKYSDILIDEYVFKDINHGWEQLINELLAATKVYQDVNIGSPDFRPVLFTAIHGKHGWLDIELDGGDDVALEIANFSRILSFKTCELCGRIGKLYCSDKWMHWSHKKTLCSSHAVKLLYYRLT